MHEKPRRTSITIPVADDDWDGFDADRDMRHRDPLASVMYDRLGAEVRGLGEVASTFMDTLMEGSFTRPEAFALAHQFVVQFLATELNGG